MERFLDSFGRGADPFVMGAITSNVARNLIASSQVARGAILATDLTALIFEAAVDEHSLSYYRIACKNNFERIVSSLLASCVFETPSKIE